MNNTIKAIGFPWFTAEEYDACMRIMSDREKLYETYTEWLKAAEIGEKQMIAKGYFVVRAAIHPKEFSEWCKSRCLNIDSKARGIFAQEAAHSYALSQIK